LYLATGGDLLPIPRLEIDPTKSLFSV